MFTVKKILSPTDFSEPSYEALEVACDLAQQFSAELCLVHVIPTVPVIPTAPNQIGFDVTSYQKELEAHTEEMLDKVIKERIPKGIKVKTLIKHDDPGHGVLELANADQYDLVVISTHGMAGLKHLLFGSVTERIVKSSSIPVLTVPYHQEKHSA